MAPTRAEAHGVSDEALLAAVLADHADTPDMDPREFCTEEEHAALEADVARQLQRVLTVPEDLEAQLARLEEATLREHSDVKRQALALAQQQVDAAGRAVGLLRDGERQLGDLQGDFSRIDGLIGSMQSVASYDRLRELHFYGNNLATIVEWADALDAVQDASYAEAVDDGDYAEVYKEVALLQGVRAKLAPLASRYRTQVATLRPHFDATDHVAQHLLAAVENTLEQAAESAVASMAADDDGSMARLAAALEVVQGEEDEPVLQHSGASDYAPIVTTLEQSPLCELRVRELLEAGVDRVFDEEVLQGIDDPFADIGVTCEAMEGLVDFMASTEEALLPLPAPFDVAEPVLHRYHTNCIDVLRRACDPSVSSALGSDLVRAVQFCDWYRENCLECGWVADTSDFDAVATEVLEAAVTGLQEHLLELTTKCVVRTLEETVQREPTGRLFTNGANDFLHVVNAALKAVTAQSSVSVLRELATAVGEAVRCYQEEMTARLDWDEFQARRALRGEDAPPGDAGDADGDDGVEWVEWLCAVANDCADLSEHINGLARHFEPLQGDPDSEEALGAIEEAVAALPQGATVLLCRVVDYVLDMAAEASWKAMFRDPKWQANPAQHNPLDAICNTVSDFTGAASDFLRPAFAAELRQRLLRGTYGVYVDRLLRYLQEGNRFTFARCVDRDQDVLRIFWADHTDQTAPAAKDELDHCDAALRSVHRILSCAGVTELEAALGPMVATYGDCPSFAVALLIEARGDWDKRTREAAMTAWRAAIAPQARGPDDTPSGAAAELHSVLGEIDRGIEQQQRTGWFSRKQEPAAPAKPGHRRTASSGATASPEPPQRRRRIRATALPLREKKKPDVQVTSLADLLAAQ